MSARDIGLKRSLPWLISVANLLLKGTSNLLYIAILSVFLKHFGADFLPWFYIILNISFIGFQFGVTPHLVGREGHPLLIATQLGSFALTIAAGLLIDSQQLYVLIACLALARLLELITSQAFSAMNNELLTIQESKAYLSYIYAAGSIGYILSGLMLKLLIDIISINKLLFLNGIVLSGLIFILAYIGRVASVLGLTLKKKPIEANKTELAKEKSGPSQPTHKQKLARNLSLAAFLIVFNTFMVDFLYSGVISSHFTSSDSLASFMGVFGASTDLSIIILQATVMNWVFSAVPMGRMLVFMPAALTMLCLAFWVSPTFALVVGIQYLVIANSRMLTQPSTVIYMGALKQEDRIFYRRDMSVMSSIGSLLVGITLILTRNYISSKLLFLMVGIFYIILSYLHSKLDSSYSETLQESLVVDDEGGEQNWDSMLELLPYNERLKKLSSMLEAKEPRARLMAIKACAPLEKADAKRLLQGALLLETNHSCLLELTKTLVTVLGKESWELIAEVIEGTEDERLIADILETLGFTSSYQGFEEQLMPFMQHSHHRIRSNAIMSILRLSFSRPRIMEALSGLVAMTRSPNSLYRAAAAGVMGELQLPLFVSALEALGMDKEPSVNKTAALALYKIRTPRCIQALEQMIGSASAEVSQLAARLHSEASAENVKRVNVLLHSLSSAERNQMISELRSVGLRGVSKTLVKILELEDSEGRQGLVRLLSHAKPEVIELVDGTLEALKTSHKQAYSVIVDFLKHDCNESLLEVPPWLPLVEALGRLSNAKQEHAALKHFYTEVLELLAQETALLFSYMGIEQTASPLNKAHKNSLYALWKRHTASYLAVISWATARPSVAISANEGAAAGDNFSASLSEELLTEFFGKELGLRLMALGRIRQRGVETLDSALVAAFCGAEKMGKSQCESESRLVRCFKNGELL